MVNRQTQRWIYQFVSKRSQLFQLCPSHHRCKTFWKSTSEKPVANKAILCSHWFNNNLMLVSFLFLIFPLERLPICFCLSFTSSFPFFLTYIWLSQDHSQTNVYNQSAGNLMVTIRTYLVSKSHCSYSIRTEF